jgi:hypothetical protein
VQKFDFSLKTSPNPVSKEQVHALVEIIQTSISEPPEWLRRKLGNGVDVCAIGGKNSIFQVLKDVCQKSGNRSLEVFKREDVWDAIYKFCDINDEDMAKSFTIQPDMVIPKLALLAAVVTKLRINHYRFIEANGNTMGVLGQTKFWKL